VDESFTLKRFQYANHKGGNKPGSSIMSFLLAWES